MLNLSSSGLFKEIKSSFPLSRRSSHSIVRFLNDLSERKPYRFPSSWAKTTVTHTFPLLPPSLHPFSTSSLPRLVLITCVVSWR